MCVYLYILNKYTVHTHYVQKNFYFDAQHYLIY